jgi:hypothetical protein
MVSYTPLPGDVDLGAHTVGGGGEQRALEPLEGGGVEEAGETAEAAEDLGALRLLHPLLHQLYGAVARLDVDSGSRVGRAGGTARRRRGLIRHRRHCLGSFGW